MEKAVVYQALKLIEQLYMDGHLSQEMYNLILEDYKTQADLACFKQKMKQEKGSSVA